jgi:hypothetical protein
MDAARSPQKRRPWRYDTMPDILSKPAREVNRARQRKAALVELGTWILARGEWRIVHALTRILQREGLRHA